MNNIIVNPESNPELSRELESILSDFTPTADTRHRDNCIAIAKELFNELMMNGYDSELVSGYFRVDNYYGWLDPDDFYPDQRVEIMDRFGNLSRDSLERYVDSLPKTERDRYVCIPHVYLVLDNLILDAASDMFSVEITPNRYLDEDGEQII